jgi:glucose-1-phosphate adenylyltransferase
MARSRILALIQAGGAGGRMDVLTRERAKPALPFAGVYRLVDFPLSNLANSGISDVWVSVQYQGGTIEEAVFNGRPWDLDRTSGGLRLLPPQQGTGSHDEGGFAEGNADLLFRVRDQVRAFDPELILVLSADHVYRFDYTDAIETHRRLEAECTIVTSEVSLTEAADHATVEYDGEQTVTGFAYKPEQPSTGTVATEVFVYDPQVLIEVLERLHHERSTDPDGFDNGLGDFGESLVPRLVDRGRTVVHPMPGYWRDVGEPEKYLAAHRDVLTDDLGIFGDPSWPIMTRQPQRVPGRVLAGGRVEDSLLSPGVRVSGEVVRSVLGPGVVVEEGAMVRDSVVFADSVVGAGAVLDGAIVDEGCLVAAGSTVGGPAASGGSEVTIGRDSIVQERLDAGGRLEPGTTRPA